MDFVIDDGALSAIAIGSIFPIRPWRQLLRLFNIKQRQALLGSVCQLLQMSVPLGRPAFAFLVEVANALTEAATLTEAKTVRLRRAFTVQTEQCCRKWVHGSVMVL